MLEGFDTGMGYDRREKETKRMAGNAVFIHVLNFNHIRSETRRALAARGVLMYNCMKQ